MDVVPDGQLGSLDAPFRRLSVANALVTVLVHQSSNDICAIWLQLRQCVRAITAEVDNLPILWFGISLLSENSGHLASLGFLHPVFCHLSSMHVVLRHSADSLPILMGLPQ